MRFIFCIIISLVFPINNYKSEFQPNEIVDYNEPWKVIHETIDTSHLKLNLLAKYEDFDTHKFQCIYSQFDTQTNTFELYVGKSIQVAGAHGWLFFFESKEQLKKTKDMPIHYPKYLEIQQLIQKWVEYKGSRLRCLYSIECYENIVVEGDSFYFVTAYILHVQKLMKFLIQESQQQLHVVKSIDLLLQRYG